MAHGFDVRGWVDNAIGIRRLSTARDGHRELTVNCPSCGRVNKLSINAKTGRWVCYSEGVGGEIADLIALVMGKTKQEAWRWVLDHSDKVIPRHRYEAKPETVDVGIPEDTIPVWDEGAGRWSVPAYMRKRGISKMTAKAYSIGYCLRGPYANRLILPVIHNSKVVGFQGRTMVDAHPKFLNPNFPKASYLFGRDLALAVGTLLVVEGPTDVIALYQKGYASVGMMGKAMSNDQLTLILLGGHDRVIFLPDTDDLSACKRALEHLVPFEHHDASIDARIGWMPPGIDPGAAKRSDIRAAINGSRKPTRYDLKSLRRGKIPPSDAFA